MSHGLLPNGRVFHICEVMNLHTEPYSYLTDTTVPAFRKTDVFTVMDAHCALCARGARWIAHNDSADAFGIVPLQSPLGNALMRHYGLDPNDPLSWLYVENGRAFTSLDAVIRVGTRLGGIWKILAVMRILPRFAQDFLYGLVARNRVRLSGTADLCNLPDPEIIRRLIQ